MALNKFTEGVGLAMHTEEQAREKLCPLKVVGSGSSASRCSASDCMMWRNGGVDWNPTTGAAGEVLQEALSGREHPRVGYCGLAGKLDA